MRGHRGTNQPKGIPQCSTIWSVRQSETHLIRLGSFCLLSLPSMQLHSSLPNHAIASHYKEGSVCASTLGNESRCHVCAISCTMVTDAFVWLDNESFHPRVPMRTMMLSFRLRLELMCLCRSMTRNSIRRLFVVASCFAQSAISV